MSNAISIANIVTHLKSMPRKFKNIQQPALAGGYDHVYPTRLPGATNHLMQFYVLLSSRVPGLTSFDARVILTESSRNEVFAMSSRTGSAASKFHGSQLRISTATSESMPYSDIDFDGLISSTGIIKRLDGFGNEFCTRLLRCLV